jgi:hypothetical protein
MGVCVNQLIKTITHRTARLVVTSCGDVMHPER